MWIPSPDADDRFTANAVDKKNGSNNVGRAVNGDLIIGSANAKILCADYGK